jgi:hypothetical protein
MLRMLSKKDMSAQPGDPLRRRGQRRDAVGLFHVLRHWVAR